MRLSIKTCTLDMPFAAMLDFCVAQGVQAVEIGTGNWSGAPHIDLDELLGSETARQRWMDQLRRRDIALCALNCSGNPLAFQKDWEVTEKTFRLAKLLGVEKIVMMSGLPAGCPGDKTPVWITTSWPPETQDILDYQWNEVAIPKWKELVRMAEDCGIRQIALENHGMQLVYNPETLFCLREAVGPLVGMNLDPSHLFWMGGDPIEAARVLGEQNALAFCNVIRQAGYEPVVYMNLHWAGSMYGMEELAHLPVWLASYGPVPALDRGVTLWQYSESGVVDGIEGPVDLDLWFTKE